MKNLSSVIALSALALSALAGNSLGAVIFSGSAGARAAEASFAVNGSGQLVVTLTNTSTADTLVPADILTAVFFDISGPAVSLSRDSAVLNVGSIVEYDAQPAGGVVGGEWAYIGGLSNAPGNAKYGISSTGINIFGPGDLFPGPDLAPPTSPDGPQYGIVTAGDDVNTGNGGITGSGGLIKNSVVFTLGGAGAGFDLSRIGNVLFFYGTAIGEVPPVLSPTPGTAALIGLAGITGFRRRRN